MKKLDQLDILILERLQQDAKITHKELASDLNVSTKPVFDRIKRLEKEGVIKKYVALLDEKKVDKKILAFSFISLKNLSINDMEDFHLRIKSYPQVMEVHQTAGNYDYLIKVLAKDIDDFQHFLSISLTEIQNIGRIQTSLVTQTIKTSTEIRNIKSME